MGKKALIFLRTKEQIFKDKKTDITAINLVIKYSLGWALLFTSVAILFKKKLLVFSQKHAGDKFHNESKTQNVLTIDNIPKNIPYADHLEVRWEVVMPNSVFEELNAKAKLEWTKIFSNPRNAASWSLRMKDNTITKQRKLKFFAYDLANFEEFRIKENKQSYFDTIKDLESLWFEISSYFKKCKNIESVINEIKNFWDVKSQIDFDIDWLVL